MFYAPAVSGLANVASTMSEMHQSPQFEGNAWPSVLGCSSMYLQKVTMYVRSKVDMNVDEPKYVCTYTY